MMPQKLFMSWRKQDLMNNVLLTLLHEHNRHISGVWCDFEAVWHVYNVKKSLKHIHGKWNYVNLFLSHVRQYYGNCIDAGI